MYIDWMVFFFSMLVGMAIGFSAGMFGAHHFATEFAKKIFDSMLLLRRQAQEQMDAYDRSQKQKPTTKPGDQKL